MFCKKMPILHPAFLEQANLFVPLSEEIFWGDKNTISQDQLKKWIHLLLGLITQRLSFFKKNTENQYTIDALG